jgi:hypothetical protein
LTNGSIETAAWHGTGGGAEDAEDRRHSILSRSATL